MEIRLAENGDLSGWVQLVEPMRHLFPGLETPESVEGYARELPGSWQSGCSGSWTRPVR